MPGIQQPLGRGRGNFPESSLYPGHASSLLPTIDSTGPLAGLFGPMPGTCPDATHAAYLGRYGARSHPFVSLPLPPYEMRGYNMSKDDSCLSP